MIDPVEWLGDAKFPANAPIAYRGQTIRVGWHPELKRVLVRFEGVSPSDADLNWAYRYISLFASEIGIDPASMITDHAGIMN